MSALTATTTSPETPSSAAAVPLTAMDRCDRCTSQAYVRATLPTGMELLFCGHHANEHHDKLVLSGATFHDETEKLTIKRESGFSV